MYVIKQHDIDRCPKCDVELVPAWSKEGCNPDGSGRRFIYGECLQCGWDTTDPSPLPTKDESGE